MTMKRICAALLACSMIFITACSQLDEQIKPSTEPVVLTIWHYYNGPQKAALEQLITKFNESVGQEKKISVEAVTYGDVVELSQGILNAAAGKVGAPAIPDIFAAYADTAYQIDKIGLVADISSYLTEDELNEFIPSYLSEGKLGTSEGLKIFPTAKSTEVMVINKTDWDKFSTATGIGTDKLATMEGIVEVSEAYYEYSGGKSFFGRDAMANYMIIGLKQLGVEIFEVTDGNVKINLDKTALRTLWDNYYVPFVKGHFGAYGKFRSDDVKTGDIIALVGATTGVAYFPNEVIAKDGKYPIEAMIMRAPGFKDGEYCAVQQGAGMVVTKNNEAHEKASVEFLKWFVQAENNIQFGITSGYVPVKKAANDIELIRKEIAKLPQSEKTNNLEKGLEVAIDIAINEPMYTNKAFEKGTEARSILETSLFNKAKSDYKLAIDNKLTKEEIIAKYVTDENFEIWYQAIYTDFKQLGLIA